MIRPFEALLMNKSSLGLTSDVSQRCGEYDSQDNKENGNASPRALASQVFLHEMAIFLRIWRGQIIPHR